MNNVQKEIRSQWDESINSGIIPCFEFELAYNDYLIVDIELSEEGDCFIFSFDKDRLCDTHFSGEVKHIIANNYQLDIDEYCDKLEVYLQQIYNEIVDGYLLPNGLYYCE